MQDYRIPDFILYLRQPFFGEVVDEVVGQLQLR
jgi:hypothetical protein